MVLLEVVKLYAKDLEEPEYKLLIDKREKAGINFNNFSVTKDVTLNCTHYILFKLNNKRELQNIANYHSADIDYKDFIKIYRVCTKKPFNFFTIDTTKDNEFIKNFDETL